MFNTKNVGLFFFVIMTIVFITSCARKYEEMLRNNTAEVREFMFEGEQEGVKANLICGRREKDYKLNGYSNELIEFGVLTFVLCDEIKIDTNNLKYILYVGINKYEGVLQKNPFDESYVTDLQTIIDKTKNVLAKIYNNDFSVEISLRDVSHDFQLTCNDVYKLVVTNFKNEIKKLYINGEFVGETYLKIINDADQKDSDYLWYFMMINRTGGKFGVLLSPYNGEILAVSNTLD